MIAVAIHLAWLALWAIFGWHILQFVGVSANLLKICRALIVIIALLDAFSTVAGSGVVASPYVPSHPSSPSNPSSVIK